MKKSETFEAALAKQQALQAEIAEVVKQLGGGGELQVLAIAAAEERTRVASFLAQHGGEERMPAAMQEALAMYRQRAEDAAARHRAAKEKDSTLRARLADLRGRLAAAEVTCAADELRQLQEKHVGMKAQVDAAKKRIQEIKAEIEQARSAIPNVAPLKQKRQELLAKQAIGEDVTADLQEVERQLQESDEAGAKAAAQGKVVETRETLTGLERLVLDVGREVEQMERETLPAALRSHLQALAEIYGKQYAQAAQALLEAYARVVAVGSLHGEHWDVGGGLRLPNLPPAQAANVYELRHQLNIADTVAALRAELQAEGIRA